MPDKLAPGPLVWWERVARVASAIQREHFELELWLFRSPLGARSANRTEGPSYLPHLPQHSSASRVYRAIPILVQ
jgi:hypothetical protein